MRTLRVTLLASVLAIGVATSASASWPTGGKFVSGVPNGTHGARLVRMYDIPGGDLYVFVAGKGSLATGYGVQRLAPGGDAAPGWPATGAGLVFTSSNTPAYEGYAVDDSACFWRTGSDGGFNTGTRALFLQPDATLKPASGSYQVYTASHSFSAAAPGLSGDMYLVANGNRVKRFTRAGVQVAGWPANGVIAGGGMGAASLVPDGTGGVIWFNTGGSAVGTPGAMRILAGGVKDPAWGATALPLTTDPAIVDMNATGLFQPLVRSGSDHFIAAWTGPNSTSEKNIFLQRFSVNGTLDPNWPVEGVALLGAPGAVEGVTLVEDGSGGVYVLWYQDGAPVAAHILADLGAAGSVPTSLLPEGASFVRPMFGFPSIPVAYLAADATPDGRLMFAWDDHSLPGTPRTRVRWFLPDLTPDPSEPSEGRIIDKASPGVDRTVSTVRAVHSDGLGGAYVAWQVIFFQQPSGPTSSELWMTRVLASELLGVPHSTATSRVSLSVPRPNPARDAISFDLTHDGEGSVHVELLDVSGRAIRSRTFEGAGTRTFSFEDLGNIPPGLYFVRARSVRGTSSQRFVLSH